MFLFITAGMKRQTGRVSLNAALSQSTFIFPFFLQAALWLSVLPHLLPFTVCVCVLCVYDEYVCIHFLGAASRLRAPRSRDLMDATRQWHWDVWQLCGWKTHSLLSSDSISLSSACFALASFHSTLVFQDLDYDDGGGPPKTKWILFLVIYVKRSKNMSQNMKKRCFV